MSSLFLSCAFQLLHHKFSVTFTIMSCSKCRELHTSVRNTPVVNGAALNPSPLELAYMINLEYYIDMDHSCIHKILENTKAKVTIKEMADFLDSRKWQLGTRTNYNGKNIITH